MAANGQRTVAAILVAAGDGVRLGAGQPKALCQVAGRTLLEHCAQRFTTHPQVRDVVVVAPPAHVDTVRALVPHAAVVAGGASRLASVEHGLSALSPDVDTVLVHDVARPFVPAEVISRVIAAVCAGADAVIPVVPCGDTVKAVDGDLVTATLERAALRVVQTPQAFRRHVLTAAHAAAHHEPSRLGATDDAALVEAIGVAVYVVDGADESFKITRPWDLRVAEAVASR